jgi:dihydroorotate dehydrogenase
VSVKPWLWLSPSLAHKVSPLALKGLGWITPGQPESWNAFEWRRLHFPNRLGIAGGVDKDARNIRSFWNLGAGFLEIGTITPRPQPGNTPPVLDRDVVHQALWNRLGFPSQGVQRVKRRLQSLRRPYPAPIFLNIGKNASTPIEHASQDYIELLSELAGIGDGFVVNISSPNTKGLRDLLRPDKLKEFLIPIARARPETGEPLLLKLSPDMEDRELGQVLEISHDLGIDGWVLTNTSQGLRDGLNFPREGGVSGRPLSQRSKEVLRRTLELLGPRRNGKLVVSVGGVMSPEEVNERLAMGADLVQVYSVLIFEGPFFFRKVARWHSQAQKA